MTIRASIDIGSNSCLLLIAKLKDGRIDEVLESHSYVTGLGRGLDENGVFAEEAMQETYESLAAYTKIAAKYSIKPLEIIATATEASRVAKNASNFYSKILKEIGIKINIISSEAEAHFAAVGVLCDEYNFDNPTYILDIGGASTELIKLNPETKIIESSFSMPIGSVRYTNWIEKNEVLKNITNIQDTFDKELKASSTEKLCCVAGTMTSVANMYLKNPEFIEKEVHGLNLDVSEVIAMKEKYQNYTSEDFLKEFPFLEKRSRTIKGGIDIICFLVESLGVKELYVSTYGLRYGTLATGFIDKKFIVA